jgi:hypothetical protein
MEKFWIARSVRPAGLLLPPHSCQRLLYDERLQICNRFFRSVLRGHHRVLMFEGHDVVVASGNERCDDSAPVHLSPAWHPEAEAAIGPHPPSRRNHARPSDLVLLQLSVLCVAVHAAEFYIGRFRLSNIAIYTLADLRYQAQRRTPEESRYGPWLAPSKIDDQRRNLMPGWLSGLRRAGSNPAPGFPANRSSSLSPWPVCSRAGRPPHFLERMTLPF